jgi:hypothetical protein
MRLVVYYATHAEQEGVVEITDIGDEDGGHRADFSGLVDGTLFFNREWSPCPNCNKIDPYTEEPLCDCGPAPQMQTFDEIFEERVRTYLIDASHFRIYCWNVGSNRGQPCTRKKMKRLVKHNAFDSLLNGDLIYLQEVSRSAYAQLTGVFVEDEWHVSELCGDSVVIWRTSCLDKATGYAKFYARCAAVQFSSIAGDLLLPSIHVPHHGRSTEEQELVLKALANVVTTAANTIVAGDFNASRTIVGSHLTTTEFAHDPKASTTIKGRCGAIDHMGVSKFLTNIYSEVIDPVGLLSDMLEKLKVADDHRGDYIPDHKLLLAVYKFSAELYDRLDIHVTAEDDD